jgi:cytochrome c oxidase assembly factor CtaG
MFDAITVRNNNFIHCFQLLGIFADTSIVYYREFIRPMSIDDKTNFTSRFKMIIYRICILLFIR